MVHKKQGLFLDTFLWGGQLRLPIRLKELGIRR